jgi:hypothetical protein
VFAEASSTTSETELVRLQRLRNRSDNQLDEGVTILRCYTFTIIPIN